jgi:hypothetical protein
MFEIITIEELLNRLSNYNHKELHVHHTWRPSKKDFNGNNGLQLQEGMRNYHVNTLGWSDIGQHVTLLPNGLFVTGRDFGKTPASILGYNVGGFACEMLGNFDVGNDILEGAQKQSILGLARYFYDKNKYIRFHRENAAKSCPGTGIDKEIFMNEVKTLGVKIPAPVVVTKGDPYVRQLQELCNEAGLKDKYGNVLVVDGLYGEKTESAIPLLYKGCDKKYKWIIRLMQKILITKGYKLPKYGADGGFGDETVAAVKLFQSDKHLVPDCKVGKITWSRILGV